MMTSNRWIPYPVLLCLGLLLPFLAYKINEDNQKQVYIQHHSPLLKLPIVARIKGWGTLRLPNKIYARLGKKDHPLNCSNKYFNSTLGLDSILVHYDSGSDRVVLAHSPITQAYGLLVVVALVGLLIAIKAGVEIRQQLAKGRTT